MFLVYSDSSLVSVRAKPATIDWEDEVNQMPRTTARDVYYGLQSGLWHFI
jgi:hypothetical protein